MSSGEITRIAIVDRCEAIRMGFQQMVRTIGHHEVVLCAANSDELLKACRTGLRIDLVLMHMDPEVLEGFAVLAMMKRSYPSMHAIALAHGPVDGIARRAVKAGAKAVLPFFAERTDLQRTLHEVLTAGSSICQHVQQLVDSPDDKIPEEALSAEARIKSLSPRERELLALWCGPSDMSVRAAAEAMGISYHTAEAYRKQILKKFDVHSQYELLHQLQGMQANAVGNA